MIQARSIYGGWPASVFSSAKNDNRIGWVQFLKRGIVDDTYANREENPRKHSRDYSDHPKRPAFRNSHGCCRTHPCAKNSEISGAEMAPSRKMHHRSFSSEPSTIFVATVRDEVPPATIMAIRS